MSLIRLAGRGLLLFAVLTVAGCGGTQSAATSSPASASASLAPVSSAASPASASASAPAKPAASAASPAGAAGAAVRLSVSFSSFSSNTLPIWIAQESGIYRKHGIEVEARLITGASYVAALLSGETPVAHGGGSEAVVAGAGGADIVVIGTIGATYPFFFLVPSSIRTVADLKGKKLGVTAIGTPDHIATRVVLQKNGLDPDKDVTIIAVGQPTRLAALESGAIQGGMLGITDKLKYEANGGHTMFDLSTLNLPAATTAIEVKRSWLSSRRDLAQNYVDAIVEAIARMKADRPLSIELLKKYLKTDDQAVLNATYEYGVKTLPSLPYPTKEQFSDFVTELGKLNPQVVNFDASNFIDPSLVKSAESRGLHQPVGASPKA